MKRSKVCVAVGLIVSWLIVPLVQSAQPVKEEGHTIFGIVQELRSGTADVPVCLCDGETGLPLLKETYQLIDFGKSDPDGLADKTAIAVTNKNGEFRFENVPDGKYRLLAQKWIGPYKGIFELHGTVIQLMGSTDAVTVPRPKDHYEALVVLRPSGDGIVQFDQVVPNSSTFMFLSLSAPEFDPILGLSAMGTSFQQRLIGVNRMPLGKTTVIGVPNKPIYAFFFAPDNSPGYAAVKVEPSPLGLVRVPAEPFVAGWSDGRKTPPPELADLMKFMEKHSLTTQDMLKIPKISNATYEAYRARMQELMKDLSSRVELPEGQSARVGDLLAVEAYRRLLEYRRLREERVAKLEQAVPVKTDEGRNVQNQADLRERVNKRFEQDQATYTKEELVEIERLYQIVNKEWDSPEAQEILKKLIEKYPKASRTGCALQYLGQMASGEEKEKYLKQAIKDFSDCYYGSGVQVGAYARLYLAHYYRKIGKKDEALALFEEIRKDYPDAINHNGRLLKDILPK